jgi:hypothetical protein
MSATPIDSPPAPPPRTGPEQELDLQAKMQYLISLQYQEQQRLVNPSYGTPPLSSPGNVNRLSFSRSKQYNLESLGRESGSSIYNDEVVRAPHPSIRDRTNSQVAKQPDVGKGTIVFSGALRNFSSDEYSPSSPSEESLQQQLFKLQQHLSPHIQSSSSTQSPPMSSSKPPPAPPGSQNTFQPIQEQSVYSGYGSVQQEPQHHEFHYGNPDYHDPYDKIDHQKEYLYDKDNDDDHKRLHQRRRRQMGPEASSSCSRICCLYRPIVKLLRQENLLRSYCYGAIDGLLTGAGLTSAFWGLGVLTVRTAWEVRLAIVALSVAACMADSLCMALGHVWTTYVVASNHAEERLRERELLEHNKADAKVKLVEMLLARGMLKIDAMSLADTLEGYPELFVSSLVGDSLLAGSDETLDVDQTDDVYHIGASASHHQHNHDPHVSSDPASTLNDHFGSFGSWKFPSYGQLHSEHQETALGHTYAMFRESRKEGWFMMMGFSTFAVLPGLLWLFLPLCFPTPSSSSTVLSRHVTATSPPTTLASSSHSAIVALPGLIIFILSIVVWGLGVWKSRFVDSNWMVFGMETIAVLLVCVFSAYFVAVMVAFCLGLESAKNKQMLPDEIVFHDL